MLIGCQNDAILLRATILTREKVDKISQSIPEINDRTIRLVGETETQSYQNGKLQQPNGQLWDFIGLFIRYFIIYMT